MRRTIDRCGLSASACGRRTTAWRRLRGSVPLVSPRTDIASPEDVILRDGTTLRLREPIAADVDAIATFFARLSERSRFLRFHGLGASGSSVAKAFVDPDWEELGALIGTLREAADDERIVALGSYSRLRDRRTAEAAFAVADDYQRRGIGTRLLERLAERASANGIERFVAEVLPDNDAMLKVFENVGFRAQRALEGGVYEVLLPLESTEEYRERVDERDHVAVQASLEPFFHPASAAVIGASSRRGSIGGELFRNILAADFRGAAYPVNRDGEAVAGVRAYTSIEEVPEPVELAIVCLPASLVNETVEASLRGADLRGAYLRLTKLDGADLSGADLRGTEGLTRAQLAGAHCDIETKLPAALVETDNGEG